MAPLFYFPTLILLLAGICLAQVISLQSSVKNIGNRITDLSTRVRLARGQHDSSYSFATGSAADEQSELLDIVLVASVDGKLHALNRTSGSTLWSMSSSVSGNAPSTLGPLVRTQHPDLDPDLTDEDSPDQEIYVIEPQSGEIYVMSNPNSPLQRLPFSMPQLVDMSPFSFSSEGENRVFVGRKETSLLLVELESGKVKATLNSECPWDPFEDFSESSHSEDLDLDELDGTKPPKIKPTEVLIGRTDYHISILHTRPRNSGPRPPVQKLTFSTYGPNNQDHGMQSMYRRTADDTYIESLPSGKIICFKTDIREEDPRIASNTNWLWVHSFSDPIVAVFDVLTSPDRPHPFVLLQPRPRIQDIFPTIDLSTAAKQNRFPNIDAAYVGLVEETGSLYAMSPDRYPFVIFGDTNFEDEGLGRSIDPPPNSPWPDGEGGYYDPNRDLPSDVDAIARRAKLKQMCRDGSKDKRCLTGVKRLESSRLSRLLDGAPSVPYPPYHHSNSQETTVNGPDDGSLKNGSQSPLAGGNGNGSIVPPHAWHPDRLPPNDAGNGFFGLGSGLGNTTAQALGALALALLAALVWVGVRRHSGGEEKGVTPSTPQNELATKSAEGNEEILVNGEVPATVAATPATSPPSEQIQTDPTTAEKPIDPSIPLAHKGASQENINPPPSPQPPSSVRKSPPAPALEHDDAVAGENGAEGEESEGEVPATPGKRKGPRRKRGRKKKGGAGVGGGGDEGAANGVAEEKEKDEGRENGNGDAAPRKVAEDEEGKSQPIHVVSPSAIVVPPPTTPAPVIPSLVVSDTVLGFGSHGTVVFKGSLQGRAVAVKRLLQDFVTLAAREVNVLQESDDHPNVIRYYYQESQANFLYIALELCPASLADIIEHPDQFRDISISFDPKRALRQITSGLRHLHALKIVHRDIKPQNILISHAKKGVGESAGHRMLISDFGLCKKLEVDQTSFLPTAHGAMAAGTVGWRAPEILRGEVTLDESGAEDSLSSRGSVGISSDGSGGTATGKPTRLTKAVDIFALGCLFYYVLTNGSHPFGDRFEREVNILKNAKNLEGLERFGEEGSEAVDVISRMLSPDAHDRPDTSTCLLHPYFWDPGKRLSFLQDASDRFEIMCREPRDPNLVELERGAINVVGVDWNARLDKWFIETLGKFRKYDGKSVQDLLRALRNKKHHYQDLPDNVKRQVGPMPEGFLSYFTRRFPRLFLHVHSVIAASSLRDESMFRTYFKLSD